MQTFKQRLKTSFIHVIIILVSYIPYNFIANNALIEKKFLMLVVAVGLLYGFIINPYIVNERPKNERE